MRVVFLWAVAAILASCTNARSFEAPLVLSVQGKPEGCRVIYERREVTGEELLAIARGYAGAKRGVVIYNVDTPYRCIGGAIYTLQRGGLASVDAVLWEGP